MKIILKKSSGVTLISLVVTIIVLIILASIALSALTGDNGIITQAQEAKEETEIGEEREILDISVIQASGNDQYGELTEDNLKKALDKNIGKQKYTLAVDEFFRVTYNSSHRTYLIDKEGNVVYDDTPIVSDKYPGDVTDGGQWDGSEEKPYRIKCVEDYVQFMKLTRIEEYQNGCLILEEDINFFSTSSYVNPETEVFGDYNRDGKTEGLLKEICNTSERGLENGFTLNGTFDGMGHTLKNFYMKDDLGDDERDPNMGMFEENSGIIKNLNIQGKIILEGIEAYTGVICVGGIVGENVQIGQIINCNACVEVVAYEEQVEAINERRNIYIGGIVGKNLGLIEGCTNSGNIKSELVAVSNVSPEYKVDLTIGGITGINYNAIINCINKGHVYSFYEFHTTVETKNNEKMIGGIVGRNYDEGIIENSINVGNIDAKSSTTEIRIGGIAGDTQDTATCIISNVYNSGEINGETVDVIRIGGVLGDGYSNLSYGYNRGKISANETADTVEIGAIIGNYHSSVIASSIKNCYYNKIDGLYGAEGKDRENITAVENLTEEQVIRDLNNNVDTNNVSNERIWRKFQYVNGEITF